MKFIRIILLGIVLIINFKLDAKIVESNNIFDCSKYFEKDKDTLFVSDCDHVIFYPLLMDGEVSVDMRCLLEYAGREIGKFYGKQLCLKFPSLLFKEIFYKVEDFLFKLIKKENKKHSNLRDILEQQTIIELGNILKIIFPAIDVIAVEEENTRSFFNSLENIKILFLTHRFSSFNEFTKKHLELVGLSLDKFSEIITSWESDILFFEDGILNPKENKNLNLVIGKGEALVCFFKSIEYKPECVVFIDDDKKNVENVEEELSKEGINCTCIWYRKSEESKNLQNLDKKSANNILKDLFEKDDWWNLGDEFIEKVMLQLNS